MKKRLVQGVVLLSLVFCMGIWVRAAEKPPIPGQRLSCQYNGKPDALPISLTAHEDGSAVCPQGVKAECPTLYNRYLSQNSGPRTGDSGNWIIWLSLMGMGLLGSVILLYGNNHA